ncbi:MAG: PrsW family intramembrane metalloprotease [Sandaracinaceae bacterium]
MAGPPPMGSSPRPAWPAPTTTSGSELPDPERNRRMVGCGCYGIAIVFGIISLFLVFVVVPTAAGIGPQMCAAMCGGAVLALPAMAVYLTVPRLLDRYDPEPWYALLMALAWGAFAACGVSAIINSVVGLSIGGHRGELISAVVSAPIVEEASKGTLLLAYLYFLRREFDGVVDGIIYASFCAIGFAGIENVLYYAQAGMQAGGDGFTQTFILRGLLTPWAHPLYTSMTGIGVGLARESESRVVRWVAPVGGYAVAVTLHAIWNGTAMLADGQQHGQALFLFVMLPLWFLFVSAFLVIVIVLVRRRGRILRNHLVDEVALGHLSQEELDIVASAFGGVTAYFRKGRPGTEFVRAVARLALSKWHSSRAMKEKMRTVSMDFIVPLRKKIRTLREQGASPARGGPPTGPASTRR